MSVCSWNCRGLGNHRSIQFLLDSVVHKQPNSIFLCETLSLKSRLDYVKSILGFEGCLVVEARGHSGGLALLWKSEAMVKILSYSSSHIHVLVTL